MKYSEIVKSLRVCAASVQDYECDGCSYREAGDCTDNLKRDAAAAIEELQKEIYEKDCFIGMLKVQMGNMEPKRGEWKYIVYHNGCTYDEDIVCSVCGKSGLDNWNYCPNCGAKMEV